MIWCIAKLYSGCSNRHVKRSAARPDVDDDVKDTPVMCLAVWLNVRQEASTRHGKQNGETFVGMFLTNTVRWDVSN